MSDITALVYRFLTEEVIEKREAEAQEEYWSMCDTSAEIMFNNIKENPSEERQDEDFLEAFKKLEEQIYNHGYKNINWLEIECAIDREIQYAVAEAQDSE